LGPNAGEVMQGYGVAMQLKAKYQDFIRTIGIHPTTSEELVRNKPSKDDDENP
jgi:pyruvate/2-oxoglutarate dehydrogenase complex dihydrolipoamide dehydrogenase (E3) component